MKRPIRTLVGSLSLLCLLALLPLGCDDNKPDTAAPPAVTASASPAPTPSASVATIDAHRTDRHGGGPATMLVRAARDLTLTDASKAKLDDIDAQLRANDGAWTEQKTLQSDLVDGIRAGKLDSAKLQTDYAGIDKATLARQTKEADALNALHAALEGGQRKALVDAVRAKQAAREAQHAAHDDGDAGSATEWVNRRVDRLTRQLALDATQQKSVTAIATKDGTTPVAMRAKRDEAKKQMDAALTAFAGDTFDANKTPLVPVGKTPHEGMQKDADFLSQLLPILTPEQRVKLATQRERGSNRRRGDGDDGRTDDDGDDNGAAHNKE